MKATACTIREWLKRRAKKHSKGSRPSEQEIISATPAQGAAPAGIAGEAEKIKQNIANNANDLRVFLCLLSNLFHQESFVKKSSPVLGGKISITKVTKEHKGEIHICVLVFPSCCFVFFVVKMFFSVNNGRPRNSIANLSRSPKSVWDKSADLSH